MQELYFEHHNLSNTYAITKIPAYKKDLVDIRTNDIQCMLKYVFLRCLKL